MVATHQMARAQVHGLWPSPMELEKTFNELKHDEKFRMQYASEVSKFVAQGACRDFRRAYENWRNPELKAAKPTFKKKNRQGTGSFLASAGVNRIQYDGHRRITLPYLGSVKLKRELPNGIPYEVRIRKHNGRWYASINYWKPPVDAEEQTHSLRRRRCRHRSSGGGQRARPLRQPKGVVPNAEETPQMAASSGTSHRGHQRLA